jgi:hypothetical protein
VADWRKGVRLAGRGGRVRLSVFGPWHQNPLEDVRDAWRVTSPSRNSSTNRFKWHGRLGTAGARSAKRWASASKPRGSASLLG